MHETKFVHEILNALKNNLDKLSFCVQEPGKHTVLRNAVVNVRLSPFSHVTSQGLEETFKEFSRETDFKEVRLNIVPLEIRICCKNCKGTSKVSQAVLSCAYCGSADLDIQIDREFFIESIELEDAEHI